MVGAVGFAGCLSDDSEGDSPEGYSFRVDGGEQQSLAPIETGDSHERFYHGGDETETTNATHGYVEADTATVFLHRNTASDGDDDALVLTYDSRESDTGGRVRVEFDESITPEEHLIVADGPFGREEAGTGDTYAASHFVHQWGSGNTDGVVLSLAPFGEPTFTFTEAEGLDTSRVLSAADGDEPAVTRTGIDSSLAFQV